MKLINRSDFPTPDVKRLTRIVLSRMKKCFIIPPLECIQVASYKSRSWEGQYEKGKITVRIGWLVKYPSNWDGIAPLPTWEDLYVGMLTWCVLLHYQQAAWKKRKADGISSQKHHRTDCQEITTRMIRQWRVDSEMKLIMEKVDE